MYDAEYQAVCDVGLADRPPKPQWPRIPCKPKPAEGGGGGGVIGGGRQRQLK